MSASSGAHSPGGGDIADQGPGGDPSAGAMEQSGEERPVVEGERASKAPRVAVVNYCENMDRFHADEVMVPEFTNDVLDSLQDYDFWMNLQMASMESTTMEFRRICGSPFMKMNQTWNPMPLKIWMQFVMPMNLIGC